MGRKAKTKPSGPTKPAIPQLLLPKPEGVATKSQRGMHFAANLIRIPNINLTTVAKSEVQPIHPRPTTTGQKLLLPKLPAGVRAPSKIIVVNNNEASGQPHVHVINTSRSASGTTDETRKRMILTGQMNMARNILPKPESLVLRPKKMLLAKAAVVPQSAIPLAAKHTSLKSSTNEETTDSLRHSRKRPVRKITEDASDGFEVYDEDGGDPAALMGHPTVLQIQLPPSLLSTAGRTILPKPTLGPTPARVVFSNGKCSIVPLHPPERPAVEESVSFRNVYTLGPAATDPLPDPNDFRHPKRKRTVRKDSAVVSPAKIGRPARKTDKELVSGKRKVGRPSLVQLSAVELLNRLKSDCLSYAADGKNLQCLACRTVLTSNGEAAYSKISKHFHADRAHKANYEIWSGYNSLSSTDGDGLAPGSSRGGTAKKALPIIKKKPGIAVLQLKRIEVPLLFISENPISINDPHASGAVEDHPHTEMDIVETAVDGPTLSSDEPKNLYYSSGLPAGSDDETFHSTEQD